MINQIKEFNKRFNIKNDANNDKNIAKFKNSIASVIKYNLGNITLKRDFRDIFWKYSGTNYQDFPYDVDEDTEMDLGQPRELLITYIKFENSAIGKAFLKDSLEEVLRYIQIIFLMPSKIISKSIKKTLKKEVIELVDLYNIEIEIVEENNDLLIYPKGAKELDDKLVNDVLIWLKKYPKSRELFVKVLEKYQSKVDVRNILDDLRLSFEMFIQEIVGNTRSLENNKSDIGKILKDKGMNVEISNMYMNLFNCYTNYQNNNVKHAKNCAYEEVEFMIYLTGSFMRLLISII